MIYLIIKIKFIIKKIILAKLSFSENQYTNITKFIMKYKVLKLLKSYTCKLVEGKSKQCPLVASNTHAYLKNLPFWLFSFKINGKMP